MTRSFGISFLPSTCEYRTDQSSPARADQTSASARQVRHTNKLRKSPSRGRSQHDILHCYSSRWVWSICVRVNVTAAETERAQLGRGKRQVLAASLKRKGIPLGRFKQGNDRGFTGLCHGSHPCYIPV